MANVYVINAHHPSDFSAGELNRALAELAAEFFADKGWAVRTVATAQGCDVRTELENHGWADLIVLDRNLVELSDQGRAEAISETRVLMTLFDGRVVYRGSEAGS